MPLSRSNLGIAKFVYALASVASRSDARGVVEKRGPGNVFSAIAGLVPATR